MAFVNLQSVNILQIIFGVQCLFSIVILFPQKNNRRLIHLLFASAALMFFNLLEELKITHEFYLITPSFSLIFGPLFYYFVRQLALNELTQDIALLYHFIPALLSLFFTNYVQLVLALGTISQVAYFALSLKILKIYKKASFDTQSDAFSLQLDWLRNVVVSMVVVSVIDLLRLNLQPVLRLDIASYWYFSMQLAYYFLISYLVVQAIRRPRLFTGLQYYLDQQEKITNKQTDAATIFSEIDQIITSEKLYQQPRFSLNDLSEHTDLSLKELSWAINDGSQLNFCDYINRYRIEEVKAKLASQEHLNLLQTALNAGFNSKSSFNKSFKKLTNMTPREYSKSIKS